MQTAPLYNPLTWPQAWAENRFRKMTLLGVALLALILAFFPLFFNTIENRTGPRLNDWLLVRLPAVNLSVPIFLIIWSMVLMAFLRLLKSPGFFLVLLWGYIILCLSRMLTIALVPLNPPDRLLELADPISNRFYGSRFITRDLFYSGHTATLFLIFLCLPKKWEKILALLGTATVGILLLIQHVHYTVDVLFAPPFTYGCYRLGKWMASPAKPVAG